MSKRQGGRPKAENDFYPTPMAAVLPLLPFLNPGWRFYEPCAGAGDLIRHLGAHMSCVGACDIEPRDDYIAKRDCRTLTKSDLPESWAVMFITNPPHTHEWLAPIIEHLRQLHPTWLLLPLDWFATKQAAPYLVYCSHIKCIGRMKIDFEDSYTTGFDNFAWARFQRDHPGDTVFHGHD